MKKIAVALLIAILALNLVTPSVIAVGKFATGDTKNVVTNTNDDLRVCMNDEGELLQFTSSGHVLGFGRDNMIIASASHMLRIDFLDSKMITPEADGNVSQESSTGAVGPLGAVTYRGIWDGVTVVYEADGTSIVKSTYYIDTTEDEVHVAHIRLGYNRPIRIDEQGNLVITYEDGTMVDATPIAWQEIEGQRQPVTVAYTLYGEGEVGFSLGDYIPGILVVIDPEITWNTFLGGSSVDAGGGIVVDGSGNIYITGYSEATWGSPMRAYTSSSDAFVAKLDESGNLIWNTFLGGSGGDAGYGVTVDGSGNVYVTGRSNATWGSPVRDFTPNGDYRDAFVAKLDISGNITWNTFLGGSADDEGHSITVDGSGNVYVTGYSGNTWGLPVRAHSGGGDAYVARLNGDGNLTWNTFMGDFGSGVAVDSSGNIYITGMSGATWGSPMRPHSGFTDTFVAKLDGSGNLAWNTFLGGDDSDHAWGLAVDGNGNVYVTGESNATWGSPTRDYTGNDDAYVARLDGNGNLTWNTFLGGSYEDKSNGITVDGSGNVYVTGSSGATWGSPVWANSYLQAFVVKIDNSGNITGNTFLGSARGDHGYGIAVDGSGNVYVAGVSGGTWGSPIRLFTSGDFPEDAFVAKLSNAMLYEPVNGNGALTDNDNGIDLWVWFIAGGGFIFLVIAGVLIKRRRRSKYMNKSIVVYLLLLGFALLVFSIPWYSGHYMNWETGSYEYKNVDGWDLIEWQWNKTLDDSSFPYLMGIGLGIIAIAIKKYPPFFLILTLIAGGLMLFAAYQCLVAGYNSLPELNFQPPEVIKIGGVLAFITPVAYMVISSILFVRSISPDEEYKVPAKTALNERHYVRLAVVTAMADNGVSSLLGGTIDATANNVYINETTLLDVPTYIVGGIASLTYTYSVASNGAVSAISGPLAD